jgi:fructose-bisphosphate aldolase/2-amino-3,7-dideoxy-D-threo-hept-6-ulosonate synthase
MGYGKKLRLGHIFDAKTDTALIVLIDHPVVAYFEELEDPRERIKILAEGGANAFLLRRGLAKFASSEYAGRAALILRVSCASGLRNKLSEEIFVSTVEEALRLGADAVAATLFVGSEREPEDLQNLGFLSDACDEWDMPLLGEMMPIGGKDALPYDGPYSVDDLRLAVRFGAEEGVDFIKTHYTGDPVSFRKVVKYSTVPIVIAGGPKKETVKGTLEMVKEALDAGAAGICMGRNLWGYKDPQGLLRALIKVMREKTSVEQAMKELSKDTKKINK